MLLLLVLLCCVIKYDCRISIDYHNVIELTQHYDSYSMAMGIFEPEAGLHSTVMSRAHVVNSITGPVRCEVKC